MGELTALNPHISNRLTSQSMDLSCRERRLFCDRKHPCAQCTSKGTECTRPSGLAQAKGFSRRMMAYNTGPSKRIRTDHGKPTPVSPGTFDGEHQDRGQASTSDNGPLSLFLHSVADPNRENPTFSLFPLASHPAPVAPITYGIALVTRITTSRVVRHIHESGCPTLTLFLEEVHKLWNLTPIERITHVQIVIAVKVDTGPMVQVIDISLDSLPQWEMAMKLARRSDNAVVIVEIS